MFCFCLALSNPQTEGEDEGNVKLSTFVFQEKKWQFMKATMKTILTEVITSEAG